MKLFYVFYSSAAVIILISSWSYGQSFYDVNKFFANMSFGQVHHGTFNMSECAEDMISCWEAIYPDGICHQWIQFATICDMMRQYCLDGGYTTKWWHRWFIKENVCLYWWVHYSETRRSASHANDTSYDNDTSQLAPTPPPPLPASRRAELANYVQFHGSYYFHFVPDA